MEEITFCKLCGEPMPKGEEVFLYHGYSGPCPKPPKETSSVPWPDPTAEMLSDPQFEAIWECIRSWDINVPGAYSGYMGATGNHARAILDALNRLSRDRPNDDRTVSPAST